MLSSTKETTLFELSALLKPTYLVGLTLIVAILTIWVLLEYIKVLWLRRRMPPGPFPLPLVGNFFDIPYVKPWHKFEEWSNQYDNPLITLWNGHRPIIVCNDCWTISDLLEKRANIYSSRPRMIVMGDIVNATTNNQVALKYNYQWRTHRRLTVSIFFQPSWIRVYRSALAYCCRISGYPSPPNISR